MPYLFVFFMNRLYVDEFRRRRPATIKWRLLHNPALVLLLLFGTIIFVVIVHFDAMSLVVPIHPLSIHEMYIVRMQHGVKAVAVVVVFYGTVRQHRVLPAVPHVQVLVVEIVGPLHLVGALDDVAFLAAVLLGMVVVFAVVFLSVVFFGVVVFVVFLVVVAVGDVMVGRLD